MNFSTTNKWLKMSNNKKLMIQLDQLIMEAWSNGYTLGEMINSLPKDVQDFFLDMQFNTPVLDDDKLDISLKIDS